MQRITVDGTLSIRMEINFFCFQIVLRYTKFFIQNEVCGEDLEQITEEDLISIGLKALGHRKRFLRELANLQQKDFVPYFATQNGDESSFYSSKVRLFFSHLFFKPCSHMVSSLCRSDISGAGNHIISEFFGTTFLVFHAKIHVK